MLVLDEGCLHMGLCLALLCPVGLHHQPQGCPESVPLIASPNCTLGDYLGNLPWYLGLRSPLLSQLMWI